VTAETIVVHTQPCRVCKRSGVIEVDAVGYARWKGGAYVQDAFPTLDADQRELLMTGTHAPCWEQMWGPVNYDEEDE
jgi:hypothetical protein